MRDAELGAVGQVIGLWVASYPRRVPMNCVVYCTPSA